VAAIATLNATSPVFLSQRRRSGRGVLRIIAPPLNELCRAVFRACWNRRAKPSLNAPGDVAPSWTAVCPAADHSVTSSR